MSKPTSTGTCSLCGKSLSRAAMTRHLQTCAARALKQPPARCFHLFVESPYAKLYWLHLAAPEKTTLGHVDAFLRDIWLECCGHLSAFQIDGTAYYSQALEPGDRSMAAPLGRLLLPGRTFSYEYDFGSTTELNFKVIGFREQAAKPAGIQLLARNDAPVFPCDRCGKGPAVKICTACPDEAWMCAECAVEHECGEETLLPVVNSPRAGVCAYGRAWDE